MPKELRVITYIHDILSWLQIFAGVEQYLSDYLGFVGVPGAAL